MRARLISLLVLGLAGCAQQGPSTPAADTVSADSAPPGGDVMNVADAAIAGNDPQMALKVAQSVLANDPRNLDAIYHEAAAYYAVGRCEDAIAAYKVALSINPASSPAETGIGRCLIKQNAAEAEVAFAAAVKDDPGNAPALNDLGIARDLQGNYVGATQPYEQALLVDPGDEGTEVNLGFSLALSGDSQDALEYLGPLATAQDATPRIREDYAAALVSAGRLKDARQVLAVDLPPDQVNTLMQDFAAAIASSQAAAPAPAAVTGAAATPVVAASAPVTPVATVAPVTESSLAGPDVAPPVAAGPVVAPPAQSPPAVAPEAGMGDEILR